MNVCADSCVYTHMYSYSGVKKSVEGGFFPVREKYFITDSVYNYQNIVIINVSLTLIVFIIVFKSLMTTCP